MNDSKISTRYAKALFQAALDYKILDRVNQDMLQISEVCRIPVVKEILNNPVIMPSKKSQILHSIFDKRLQDITHSFIDLVVRNNREHYLPAIARVFIHDTLQHNGITESVLTTAIKVDDKVKQQVIDLIAGLFKTKVELKENVDESIIGGFILRIEDNYIDASVRNKLRKIKAGLESGSAGL